MRRQWWENIGIALLAAGVIALVVFAYLKLDRPPDATPAAPSTSDSTPTASESPSPTPTPTPKRKVAVFIGDASTAGAGGNGTRWTTIVSDKQGWQEVNLANAGTGYLTSASGTKAKAACGKDTCPAYGDVVDDAIAASPDVVVVSGGRIDAGRDVSSAASALFNDLHSRAPNARIIVLSPLWDAGAVPAALTTEAKAVQKAAQQADVTYVDIGQPLTGHRDLVAADGVNPNGDGQRTIADVVVSKIG
ncbi:SGNH/GDSL hydrolase family protein [Raineyella fluvialis]|uniref:SGNH hydrolase-type esterase domain-containing protein n=1 Tax=Raineyella fluvialis TaxID=2662261 RepID=A0A5Q2F9C4_9ACTN|nr:SGNH/GDSL hydrolase family protein [Raineyella fluvialis]QGF23419.1 hypothetical protein Rai3103_06780 [Raineyella fluvialis]